MEKVQTEKVPFNLFKSIGRLVGKWDRRKQKRAYFISGMCYNCKVFDKLTLPKGYRKKYIEWRIPNPDETLSEYAYEMAKNINTSKPFVLIGYSFGAFNRLFFHASNSEFEEYMTVTDPVYIKWATKQITDWVPDYPKENLYHIHGTEDQIFPIEQIRNVFPVEGGDHLMVFKKAATVSSILSSILLMKH